MADGHKKRKSSKSPSPDAGWKRVRRAPHSALDHSRQPGNDTRLAPAESAFRGDKDPYFPLQSERAASLSDRDEWAFRLKVISSSTALHHDVFEQAVQGIVRICFPQGVLEELGIDILARHMRAENAPVENIAKMRDIFRAEMIHRITWMLSEYLDTPARVETSVQSIIAASARLHSDKIGSDVLGDVVASLNGLRARVPVNSTERLATNDVFRHVLSDDRSGTVNEASSDSEVEHLEQSPVIKKRKKNRNRSEHYETDEFELNVIEPAPAPKNNKKKKKKKRESDDNSKLQENDQRTDELSSEDIHKYFKGANDVFAFHALPIAKKKLGENAKRKEIRHAMESILADMHDEEYGKWVESHQRLLAGDTGMLVRVEQDLTSHKGAATPAPIEARTPLGKFLGSVKRNFSRRSEHRNRASALSPLDQPSKSEIKTDTSASTATTTAFMHSSTKDNSSPVSIGVQMIDGSMIVTTKEMLKGRLLGHDVPDFLRRTAVKVRADMERKLVPWVVAKLSSFPELMAEPFIFVDMMPWVTCVLDIMCDPHMSMERGNNIAIKGKIFSALEERGLTRVRYIKLRASNHADLFQDTRFGPHGETISWQIGDLLGKSGRSNETRSGYLERILRRLAFTYRKEFPDLKSTLLVRTWERETGQTW
ncbi:hypothetical protein N0V83_004889 [Neocucurbitaria cava]|uniref:Uncharacterized protein n=1 Tax=Neocucurbitaria cava TaxID=798079 RepID=A0A9W8YAH6_9PLEO|nr:hypothetical protein N0V83_004889 [Neocucurbitaria cava]